MTCSMDIDPSLIVSFVGFRTDIQFYVSYRITVTLSILFLYSYLMASIAISLYRVTMRHSPPLEYSPETLFSQRSPETLFSQRSPISLWYCHCAVEFS